MRVTRRMILKRRMKIATDLKKNTPWRDSDIHEEPSVAFAMSLKERSKKELVQSSV